MKGKLTETKVKAFILGLHEVFQGKKEINDQM